MTNKKIQFFAKVKMTPASVLLQEKYKTIGRKIQAMFIDMFDFPDGKIKKKVEEVYAKFLDEHPYVVSNYEEDLITMNPTRVVYLRR